MRTPFRPSALPPTAKLLMLVGLLALHSALLTAFRSGRPISPMAGATFTISNGTWCPYAAIIHHSSACPATTIPATSTLSIPQYASAATITVAGSFMNKVEIWDGSVIIARWTCTSGTSGSWADLADRCEYYSSGLFARLQGDGYTNNKIEWEP